MRRFQRRSIAFHYDRPADFFLPWFERWRSYSHGFYRSPDDDPAEAQARKFQYAIDALGLEPGMRVLDVGAGWGGFLEYAGLRGIAVHGITISEQQYRFLRQLIHEHALPCEVEKVDLIDFRPEHPFDAAVFMGSLEHLPDYGFVVPERHPALGGWVLVWTMVLPHCLLASDTAVLLGGTCGGRHILRQTCLFQAARRAYVGPPPAEEHAQPQHIWQERVTVFVRYLAASLTSRAET